MIDTKEQQIKIESATEVAKTLLQEVLTKLAPEATQELQVVGKAIEVLVSQPSGNEQNNLRLFSAEHDHEFTSPTKYNEWNFDEESFKNFIDPKTIGVIEEVIGGKSPEVPIEQWHTQIPLRPTSSPINVPYRVVENTDRRHLDEIHLPLLNTNAEIVIGDETVKINDNNARTIRYLNLSILSKKQTA